MLYLTITAVFVVGFAVVWLLLSAHSPVSARLMAVTTQAPAASQAEADARTPAFSLDQIVNVLGPLRRYVGFTENPEIVQRLSMAGYRKASHADAFLLMRMLLPVAAAVIGAFTVKSNTIFVVVILAVVGFLLPDLWLTRAISQRKERIRLAVPDALDLLVICLEAGLGLDQALLRVGQEMRITHRELSEEFRTTRREGPHRSLAQHGTAVGRGKHARLRPHAGTNGAFRDADLQIVGLLCRSPAYSEKATG